MKKMLLCACVVAVFSATHAEVTTINGWQLNIEDGSLNSITTAGEQSLDLSSTTITNLSPSAFDVTSGPKLSQITLPASLQSFKEAPHTLIDDTFTGDGAAKTFNGTVSSGTSFTAEFKIAFGEKDDSSDYGYVGTWGSAILATGTKPTENSFIGGFQLWLASYKKDNDKGYLELKHSGDIMSTLYDGDLLTTTGFNVKMSYDADAKKATFVTTPNGGEAKTVVVNMELNTFTSLCTNATSKVTMEAKFQTLPGTVNKDPFACCANLESIAVAEGNTAISVNSKGYMVMDGTIMSLPRTPLYGKPLQIVFDNNKMLQFNCLLNASGQSNTNSRKVSLTDYTVDDIANHSVNSTLFELVNTQYGLKISALASVGHGIVDSKNDDGTGAWLTIDGTNAMMTYNSPWAGKFDIVVAGGTDTPIFNLQVYKAGVQNGNYSAQGYLTDGLAYTATGSPITLAPVTEIPVAVTEEACAMLCLPVAVSAVDGCFTVNDVKDGVAQLLAVTGTIPAATPFMIKGENTVKLSVIDANEPAAEDDASSTDANTPAPILKGCTASMPLSADAWMVNTASGSATTFAKETTPTIAAGSVYLQPKADETWPDEISLAEKIATSISEIAAPAKVFDAVYDIQGRRLVAPGRGINIINGRKVIVK